MAAEDIMFLSDTPGEIAAARAAEMQTLLIDRENGAGEIASFDEVHP